MSFRAIPRKLLIHDVSYTPKKKNTSGWGGQDDPNTITIKKVRFEPSSQVRKTGTNEEKLVKGVLFIDAKNSDPFVIPIAESSIEFNGEKLTVESSEPIYAKKDQPHHVEVTLT